ncbi:MAG: hypothetical protein ABRQ27_01900 [Clostridiaceae bacterium]
MEKEHKFNCSLYESCKAKGHEGLCKLCKTWTLSKSQDKNKENEE